jgi:hypothetical protein
VFTGISSYIEGLHCRIHREHLSIHKLEISGTGLRLFGPMLGHTDRFPPQPFYGSLRKYQRLQGLRESNDVLLGGRTGGPVEFRRQAYYLSLQLIIERDRFRETTDLH